MVDCPSEFAKQIYQIIAPIVVQDNLLTLHNYEEWRFHMTWSLISQGLWHVVRGQNWSDITLEKDDIVFRSIMYTIDDSLRSKILPSSFLSAKELWDYLRLQFAQSHDLNYDHVQQGFKAKKKQKTKKKNKEKKHEHALNVTSEISRNMFSVPVPEIHDSSTDYNCLGNILEEATYMENAQILDQSDILNAASNASNTSKLILREQGTLHLPIHIDKHYSITGFDSCEGEHHNLYQTLEYLSLGSESIQVFMPEQLELPCLCSEFDQAEQDIGIVQEKYDDFVEPKLDLLHLLVSSQFCQQNQPGLIQILMHDADQFTGLHDTSNLRNESLIHDSDMEEELLDQFPWLDFDEQNAGFSFIITKVSKHEVDFPLYIHLHIPFACTHDGKMENHSNLDDCLGYISYPGIGGLTNRLKVSYRCLHLRNQVLVTLELLESSNLISSHDLAANSSHLFQGQFQTSEQTLISEVCKGTGGAHAGAMHDCSNFSSAKVLAEQFQFFEFKRSSKGMHFSVVSQDKCREWYRGRKIWFRTNISWQAWLFLWLTLLHMLNSSTGVLSLQQCSSSGGVLDLC